ncbi:MAG: hypothetical protein QXI49_05875 [Candidatus Methanomethylicaceae archaeon]
MEFCQNCGKLLMPVKKDDKVILKCKSCGFEKDLEKSESYKIVQQVEEGKRRKMLIVEEPVKIKRKEEEKELMAEYYKVFLESYEEETEETED